MLYSHDTTIRIRIHAETKSTIMKNEHTSLEKYTSHTLFERVGKGCVWEVSWRLRDCNILTISSSDYSSTSFLFGCAAPPGVLRAQPSAGSSFSLPWTVANWLQLTQPVCDTGLYNCLTFACFLWASHLHPIQSVHSQGYTLISSTGCTCYSHRCVSYLTARPRVNMQQPDWAIFRK